MTSVVDQGLKLSCLSRMFWALTMHAQLKG